MIISMRRACGAVGQLAAMGLLTFLAPSAEAQMAQNPIPIGELKQKCGLDPDIMAGVDQYFFKSRPYVIYRNGYYCWRSKGATAALHLAPVEVFSSTKTFGAILVGAVSARSSLRDTSLLTDWLTPAEMSLYAPSVNRNATVGHVLAMTGWSKDLSYGKKEPWTYDATGFREINALVPLMTHVIQREPARFEGARNIQDFARKLLQKLGMTQTVWPGVIIAGSLQSTSADLGRLGELVLRKGMWNGEKILDEQYVYRMTHASFEDSNAGYGYLMYVNANAGIKDSFPRDNNCSPYGRWTSYPHAPLRDQPNSSISGYSVASNGGFPFAWPGQDIGVAWSQGAASSTFTVHRGLDMVIGSSISLADIPTFIENPEGTNQNWIWNNIRPALLANLPEFRNDDAAFCSAYRTGSWSMTRSPWSVSASS